MTAVTPTTTTPETDLTAHGPQVEGAGFFTSTGQTARRTVLQFMRTPQLLVLPTIIGALFLFIFRYVFGGAIDTGPVDYVDFLVPGFLVTGILWTGMNAPAGVAEDATSGVHDRLRSLPIPRSAVVAGRSVADAALNGWTLLVTAALGVAVGFRTHADIGAVVLAFALDAHRELCVHMALHQPRTLVRERAGRAGNVDPPRRPAHVLVQCVRTRGIDARLDAALRRQPTDHGDNQRRAQFDARRDGRRRRRSQHGVLGDAQPRVVRRDLRGLQHARRRPLLPSSLTPGSRRTSAP